MRWAADALAHSRPRRGPAGLKSAAIAARTAPWNPRADFAVFGFLKGDLSSCRNRSFSPEPED